ncbi:MAG: hypothetical protein Tsb009_21410 [Planctomycetaceae bacterium]
MKALKRIQKQRQRRTFRVRNQVRRSAKGRPRLSVFRSNRHIYAQIVDDVAGRTLAAASSLEKEVCGPGNYAGNREMASRIGALIAERAREKGISQVVFDRGPYAFHGRVAALAEAAREGGLEF